MSINLKFILFSARHVPNSVFRIYVRHLLLRFAFSSMVGIPLEDSIDQSALHPCDVMLKAFFLQFTSQQLCFWPQLRSFQSIQTNFLTQFVYFVVAQPKTSPPQARFNLRQSICRPMSVFAG